MLLLPVGGSNIRLLHIVHQSRIEGAVAAAMRCQYHSNKYNVNCIFPHWSRLWIITVLRAFTPSIKHPHKQHNEKQQYYHMNDISSIPPKYSKCHWTAAMERTFEGKTWWSIKLHFHHLFISDIYFNWQLLWISRPIEIWRRLFKT